MNGPEGSANSKALKVVLIVLAVLAGTALICCTGAYFGGMRVVDEVQQAIGPTVKGSGVAAIQERLVGPFHAIRVEGIIDVEVTIGGETSVTLQADDNVLPLLSTEVVEGTLIFSSRQNYDAENDVRARVVVPSLTAVTVEGIGDIEVRGLDETEFKVAVHGVGGATVHGRADTVDVEVHGLGDAKLSRLEARVVRAQVFGIGDAEVFASESLDASVEGMGDVIYHGQPVDVRTRIDGMGDVIPAK